MDDENQAQAFNNLIEEGNEEQCRALWLAVILQAILDARGKYGNSVEQRQAQIWLEGRGDLNSEFAAVCDLAGIDFEKTRGRCVKLMGDSSSLIDFRAMKREKEENRTVKNRRRYLKRSARNAEMRLARQIRIEPANDNLQPAANDNLPEASASSKSTSTTHGEK